METNFTAEELADLKAKLIQAGARYFEGEDDVPTFLEKRILDDKFGGGYSPG